MTNDFQLNLDIKSTHNLFQLKDIYQDDQVLNIDNLQIADPNQVSNNRHIQPQNSISIKNINQYESGSGAHPSVETKVLIEADNGATNFEYSVLEKTDYQ